MSEAQYLQQLEEILDASKYKLSNISPSEWAEQNRVLEGGVSAKEGKWNWDNSPCMREPLDFFSPYHPGHTMAIMKAPQFGISAGVLENAVGYRIAERPCNILYLAGHSDLLESTMNKIDKMIDGSGIRHLIKSNLQRAKANKSGDTDFRKEFAGGYLKLANTNIKSLRGESYMVIFVDDYEAMKGSTKQAGATYLVIEQRAAAFRQKRKICYVSSPELKEGSNIEPVYMLGDQRKRYISCPLCKQKILFEWAVDLSDQAKQSSIAIASGIQKGGITWQLNDSLQLIPDTVGYTCQACARFFPDHDKDKIVRDGNWVPTARPSREGYLSYQISALYAPSYMYDWEHYVNNYLLAAPPGEPINEDLMKGHQNNCLGLTYEPTGEALDANKLQLNIRNYDVGTVPEAQSIRDGNGPIILLTCAADLNGIVNDARLDYEIVGWSKSGASYSITQGSIGTFIPREGAKTHKADRERFTYEHNRPNSVWPLLDKVLDTIYPITVEGKEVRRMMVGITAVDTGHYTEYAYPYIDNNNRNVVGVKGKDREKYQPLGKDAPLFRPALERTKLYLVNVNQVKDQLAAFMALRWDDHNDEQQPANFMNYPSPTAGKYSYKDFFQHYQAEERITKKATAGQPAYTLWQKKNTNLQNHFWDVRVYNLAVRDIAVMLLTKPLKMPKATWADLVALITK